jgi:hypothetical protein
MLCRYRRTNKGRGNCHKRKEVSKHQGYGRRQDGLGPIRESADFAHKIHQAETYNFPNTSIASLCDLRFIGFLLLAKKSI